MNQTRKPHGVDPVLRSRARRRALQAIYAMQMSGTEPREIVAQLEDYVRALLRDILCGYLDSELKTVADEILIESNEEPFPEIHARDMRGERFTRESEPAPEPEPEPEPAEPTEEPELEPEPEPDASEPLPLPLPLPLPAAAAISVR